MARKLIEFETCGLRLRTRQLGAIAAFGLLRREARIQDEVEAAASDLTEEQRGKLYRSIRNMDEMQALPDILETIDVMEDTGHYESLSLTKRRTDELIKDPAGILDAHEVLERIVSSWEAVQLAPYVNHTTVPVPRHLRGKSERVELPHVDPVISALVSERLATYAELEEKYSMEDALMLFDIYMKSTIDKAVAQYDAMEAAKSKKK